MNRFDRKLMDIWMRWGKKVLPFADAASDDLPLSRLLRLSLIQFSVGISLTLLVGTLNRVMIVELEVASTIVGVMLALPLLFAPFRALIGFRSDVHQSALGWRRVPYIYRGTMLQFGGLAVMPFALLVLAGELQSADWPVWFGQGSAAIAILLVGAGVHITQTVGLALATDLAREDQQANVVGLMYVSLLVGSIVAALAFGAFLADFTPGRLIQVIQACAVITIALNFVATWKQEARTPAHLMKEAPPPPPTFKQSWDMFIVQGYAMRRLIIIGFGTLAFTMSDVLLEPYGGQVLGMGVGTTTKLTAIFAGGSLVGFAMASQILSRGGDPMTMTATGALMGLPGFALVIAAAPSQAAQLFSVGVLLIGCGAGLFGHGTLTATMRHAPKGQVGMALGAWGAVQATAAGVGAALGGVLRDVGRDIILSEAWPPVTNGYIIVYALEIILLIIALAIMVPLLRRTPAKAEIAQP
ncbi:PucC family protein [Alterisphingorhabdus coralli]|uniref:PucC family protein n=1 Tax=Alterisphingorhabdus coralli TaxID=3071408 RepID=A0AA97I063_9SPHN|nr:PucC family protein [Parasphingorhabdus sp. SCSIO 66989]WOE74552.1 PucC family protein [Parasphingorhabdus sp. SCSIO 66989]